jgi:hypothetical protein
VPRWRAREARGRRARALSSTSAHLQVVLFGKALSRAVLRVGVLLELASVILALRLGHERRRDAAVKERGEVEATEPLVLPHVVPAASQIAEALGAVGGEELAHQVARVRLDESRELDLPGEDELVDAERVLVVKRRIPATAAARGRGETVYRARSLVSNRGGETDTEQEAAAASNELRRGRLATRGVAYPASIS